MKNLLRLLLLTMFLARGASAQDFATQTMNATYKLFNNDSAATGFFIRTTPESMAKSVVLVTAGHVLSKMSGETMIIVLRKKQADGTYQRYDWSLKIRDGDKPLWTTHSVQDVAAMRVQLPDDAEVTALPLSSLATEKDLIETKLHITSPLFVMGYPNRVESSNAGFPVARHGTIASFPLIPIKSYPLFLIDFATFAGDSGGPVFTKNTRQTEPENATPIVLGMVVSQIRQTEKISTEHEERTQHFPMQLSNVAQAQFIRETIERLP